MNRQEYNRKIISKLKELIESYPDLRFGQILVDYNIIDLVPDRLHGNALVALDPFNEESEVTWNKMCKCSKIL